MAGYIEYLSANDGILVREFHMGQIPCEILILDKFYLFNQMGMNQTTFLITFKTSLKHEKGFNIGREIWLNLFWKIGNR